MAKKKSQKPKPGDQLDLIDVAPKNAKEIIVAAKLYKKYQGIRSAALKRETEQKQTVLELMKKANLQTLAGGKVKFQYNGLIVSIIPRDELVTVKEASKKDEAI